jgi:hypothetical protein
MYSETAHFVLDTMSSPMTVLSNTTTDEVNSECLFRFSVFRVIYRYEYVYNYTLHFNDYHNAYTTLYCTTPLHCTVLNYNFIDVPNYIYALYYREVDGTDAVYSSSDQTGVCPVLSGLVSIGEPYEYSNIAV